MTTLHGFTPTPRHASELRKHLESARAAYLERYARSLKRVVAGGSTAAIEVLLEQPNPSEPEQIFRLLRADLLIFEGESASAETFEGPYAIEDLLFDFAGVPVTIHDLAWENTLLTVRGPDPDLGAIAAWAALWLDVGDEREPDETGFHHVIHSVTRPRRDGDGWSMHVDFGSADADAFIELLEIVSVDAAAVDIWIPQG